MHVFIFGGLSLSSADYTLVGRSCSSRRGGEWLVRMVRRGQYVPCWLGSPCKVKSDRSAVRRISDMSTLITAPHRSDAIWNLNDG